MDIAQRAGIAAGIATLTYASDMERCGAIVVVVDDANRWDALTAVGEIADVIGYGPVRVSYEKDEVEVPTGLAPWRRRIAETGKPPMAVVFDADQEELLPSLRRTVAAARRGTDGIPAAAVLVVARRTALTDALVEAVVDGVFDAGGQGVEVVDV